MSKIVQFQVIKDRDGSPYYVGLDNDGILWVGKWELQREPLRAEFVWNRIPNPGDDDGNSQSD